MHDDHSHLLSQVRTPAFERGGLALSLGLVAVGLTFLVLVLTGTLHGGSSPALPAPPPVVASTPTPLPGPAARLTVPVRAAAVVTRPPLREQRVDRRRFSRPLLTHVPASWEAGFYPLYATASRTFGVNWLLLASIHKQETAFSTSPSTYHGLNFAGCCGGPMQFNVTNGPVTTWKRVSDSYQYAQRPAAYNHATVRHPSIYDDFDAMMAAARLLSLNGAGPALDGGAWQAAYDYYGHDATGVTYADQVLARAISWSQHGFCVNCGDDQAMVAAVHSAYAPVPAPVLAPVAVMARTARARRARRSRTPRSR